MCSSSSSSSLLLPTHNTSLLLLRRRIGPILRNPRPTITIPNPRPRFHVHASLAQRDFELSWSIPDKNSTTEYGGWAIVDSPIRHNINKKKKGLPIFVIGVIGTSLAVLVAAIAHFSLSRRGFKFQFGSPLHALHVIFSPTGTKDDQDETTGIATSDESIVVSDASPDDIMNGTGETVTSASVDKLERIIIPAAVDSTQQEALSVLKKLKVCFLKHGLCVGIQIIEDDVKADDLCTRREYARWLVRVNASLERNPKHRIFPAISLSGSTVAAFDDIRVEDPDFESIQCLAEAGVIPSKLSPNNSSDNGSEGQGDMNFFPERNSRTVQISTKKLGFLDAREISSDASVELFVDMSAGDKSILRKVFGQSKRFQPNKPSTKAQAAVTLTSGRMAEAIFTELVRLEAENAARLAEMEEIRSELLDRGDIQRFWDEKLIEVKTCGFEVEKEKAAMDCQKQLVLSLKEEVDEMSEKLASERALYITEQCNLQNMRSELQDKREGLLDTKSILEAEKEALRILRSWVEDEARKSQARAKVLQEVGRRWKWDNHA
uniref:SLH domain-containing protein n=1 Tax=Fagus sylvatica TaxID=28930 RepID=A0A2N9J883_FAGSY